MEIFSTKHKNKIPYLILICFSSALILFHIGVLLGIVPKDIVWLGTIRKNHIRFLLLETISLIVNSSIIFVAVLKGEFFKNNFNFQIVNG